MGTAKYEERYAGMSDGELADLVTAGLDTLNEEARHAYHTELRKGGLTLAALRKHYPPAAQPNDVEREPKVSVLLRQFGVFPGLFPTGFFLIVLLYIFIRNEAFAIQAVTLVGYTGFVFLFVFCDTRGIKGYSLFQKAVRQKIPRLLAIHAAFLVVVFTVVTIAPWLRHSVPDSWLVEGGRKHVSLFEYLLVLIAQPFA